MTYPYGGPSLRERPFQYSSQTPDMVFEVSLKTAVYNDWLNDLAGAHRLVQVLLQGQLMGQYRILDFFLWAGGLFVRVSLARGSSLSDFLGHIKERSAPPGEPARAFWDEELPWIKLVLPEDLSESTRLFLERADLIRRELDRSHGFSPRLFFFYRDQRLSG